MSSRIDVFQFGTFMREKNSLLDLKSKILKAKTPQTHYIYNIILHQFVYIYIYIHTYIVIHRQTVSLYHNSSEWIDTQDASSWDRNPPNFTLDLISYHSDNLATNVHLRN